MRLATLLTSLVQESSKGVLSGVTGSVEKEIELLTALEEPAASLAGDAAVQSYLREHFPPLETAQSTSNAPSQGGDAAGPNPETAIRPGALYVRPDDYDHAEEFPPIRQKLDVELSEDELHTQDGNARLSQQAVDRIEQTVRRMLGAERKEILTQTVKNGLLTPKVSDVEVGMSIAFEDDLDVSVINIHDDVDPAAVGHLTARIEFEER